MQTAEDVPKTTVPQDMNAAPTAPVKNAPVIDGISEMTEHLRVTVNHVAAHCFQCVASRKRVLIYLVSGLFFAIAAGRYLWLTVGPASWGPRFACVNAGFDCGEVSAGRVIEHEFVIGNTGRQPLRILKAVPGCGLCLTVRVSKVEVAPGDTTLLKVVLKTEKLSKGAFRKTILLRTDDPYLPKVVLCVYGVVV
jgi:hypothetical protein